MRRGITLLRALGLGLVFAGASVQALSPLPPPKWEAFFRSHLARYPAMQVQDAYKLVVQACLGSEHAVSDEAAARRWIEREVASLGEGPAEPMVDAISPDAKMVRVHLRPFLAQGGEPGKLVRAFVQTANAHRGSREQLAAAWGEVVALAEAGRVPWTAAEVRGYGTKMAAAGWPAVHHSQKFNEAYRPAYRVIAREFLAECLPVADTGRR